jgi:hypothetical protein
MCLTDTPADLLTARSVLRNSLPSLPEHESGFFTTASRVATARREREETIVIRGEAYERIASALDAAAEALHPEWWRRGQTSGCMRYRRR